jgi:hypothetical protein
MAVHTWVALKPSGAAAYTRYEVMGWGVGNGAPAVRVNRSGPDNYWFGSRPERLVDRRGDGVDELIARIQAAVEAYPCPTSYRTWPGPNAIPSPLISGPGGAGLRLDLPPRHRRDFIGRPARRRSQRHRRQVSFRLLGCWPVWRGVELNLRA